MRNIWFPAKRWIVHNRAVLPWAAALVWGGAAILIARHWHYWIQRSAAPRIEAHEIATRPVLRKPYGGRQSWGGSVARCLRRPGVTAVIQLTSPLASMALSPWLFHQNDATLARRMAVGGRKWWMMGCYMGRRYEWFIVLARRIEVRNSPCRVAPFGDLALPEHYKAVVYQDGRPIAWFNGPTVPMHAHVISAQCAADNYCADGRDKEVGFGAPRP
jgi:hypothetical protein